MANKNLKWILIGALVLIVFSMKGTVPAESVAAIEGQQCINNSDCPCWGTYNFTTSLTKDDATAYGIGIASCESGACDMTYCFDIGPVGEWTRDHPWIWMKENILFTALVAGLSIWVLFFWPKI